MTRFIRVQTIYTLILFLLLMSGCTSIRPNYEGLGTEFSAAKSDFEYDSYVSLLKEHVDDNGLVNYKKLKQHPEMLDNFYSLIGQHSPDSHPLIFPRDNDKLAYWINAYNATVIKGVVEYYPITGIEDIKTPTFLFFFPRKSGFFFFQRFTYGGQETSLYYLENSVIRDRFTDPRIHFALNCASQGCPKLPRTPFFPDKLEKQLDYETRKFINDEDRVRYDAEKNILYLSSIFKWYSEDFTGWMKWNFPATKPTLLNYVLLYLNPETTKLILNNIDKPKIKYLAYNWQLNDQN